MVFCQNRLPWHIPHVDPVNAFTRICTRKGLFRYTLKGLAWTPENRKKVAVSFADPRQSTAVSTTADLKKLSKE